MATAAFLVVAVALAIAGTAQTDWWLAAWLGLICALLSRVEFEVGDGYTRPLQLALVPMLLLLQPGVVPLVVAGAVLVAKLPDVAAGQVDARRVLFGIADCWFAVPPALLLALTGWPADAGLQVLVVALAVGAQFAGDLSVSSLRLRVGLGLDPRELLRAIAWVYLVDALLTPVGLLAAVAGERHAGAVAGVLPLGGLLAMFARERRGRIANALELQRIAQEGRERLQTIVGNSSDCILIVDADGTLRTLTGSVEPIFGPAGREARGRAAARLRAPDDARAGARVPRRGGREARRRVRTRREWRMRYADGSLPPRRRGGDQPARRRARRGHRAHRARRRGRARRSRSSCATARSTTR